MECNGVKVEYVDTELRRLTHDSNFELHCWSRAVVVAYRKKILLLMSAKDERDVQAMRSLNLLRTRGKTAGTYSVRLNDQFRLVLKFDAQDGDRVAVVLGLVECHRMEESQ